MRKKSGMVAQNYSDQDTESIATKAPTIQTFNQRLFMSNIESSDEKIEFTMDVNQAYVQAESMLEREVYIIVRSEMTT